MNDIDNTMITSKEGDMITSQSELFDYIEDRCGYFVRLELEKEKEEKEEEENVAEKEWEMIADENFQTLRVVFGELEAVRNTIMKSTKAKTVEKIDYVLNILNENS